MCRLEIWVVPRLLSAIATQGERVTRPMPAVLRQYLPGISKEAAHAITAEAASLLGLPAGLRVFMGGGDAFVGLLGMGVSSMILVKLAWRLHYARGWH